MIEISSLCHFKALNDRSVIVIADLSYNQWLIDRDWSKLESPDRDKSSWHEQSIEIRSDFLSGNLWLCMT